MSDAPSPHVAPDDKEYQDQINVDATGKEWVIFRNRGTSLYFVRPNPDRADAVIPDLMEGLFTKSERAQDAINRYLEVNLQETTRKNVKSDRKDAVSAEQQMAKIQEAVDAENAALAKDK